MVHDEENEENNYHYLDIKIPQIPTKRLVLQSNSNVCTGMILPKYRIGELVEEIFGVTLTNNRFLNASIKPRVLKKKVRFNLIELDGYELPNCRTHNPRVKYHFHAMTCSNFKTEQVEILGKRTFLARIPLLR